MELEKSKAEQNKTVGLPDCHLYNPMLPLMQQNTKTVHST